MQEVVLIATNLWKFYMISTLYTEVESTYSTTPPEPGNKITRGNGYLLFIPIQSELASFALAIVHWPPLYSLSKHARFCEPGVVTFSRRHLLFVCRRTSRRQLGENWWGSRQLRMLTWFSLIWSLCQFFLVIIDYFLGKKHIESIMLCYSLAKHARFCEPGVVTFSRRLLISLSKN